MQDWSTSFKLSDLWTAYIAGAMSVKNHPDVSEKTIQRSADAYTKLIQENEVDKQVEGKKQKEIDDFKELKIGDKVVFNAGENYYLIGIIKSIATTYSAIHSYKYYTISYKNINDEDITCGVYEQFIKQKFNLKTNQYENL